MLIVECERSDAIIVYGTKNKDVCIINVSSADINAAVGVCVTKQQQHQQHKLETYTVCVCVSPASFTYLV